MTTPNPACTINGSPTPQDVGSNVTVNGALANAAGAIFWAVSCIGTDELSTVAAVNATLSVNQGAKTFSFTSTTASGSAMIFQSVVGISGLGLDANGQTNPAFTTTFKVNVKTASNLRVLAINETLEQSAVSGWAAVINPAIRNSAGGLTITGSGVAHITSGAFDASAYLGAAGSILTTNGAATDTTWLSPGSNGQVLTVVGGVPSWQPGASGVTWANDLSTSSNTHQYVSAISGANGTGGGVTLGDGVHSLTLIGNPSLQNTAPLINLQGSAGWALNSRPGGQVQFTGGTGGTAAAGNITGGTGGFAAFVGGMGGASTGSAANSNGGNVLLTGGAPGTGGSGAAGSYGDVKIGSALTYAFATANAGGPGFGIGSTPGTDPTITRGTGVPGTTQTNGSLFLRTDGSSGANALYAYEGGVWYAIGGTSTTSATLTFEGQAFQLAAAGNGNGTILWPVGQATPTITQTIRATDNPPANISITAQSAQPGALVWTAGGNLVLTSGTGATSNGTPGNLVFTTPAPTGSGTYGQVLFNLGGTSTTGITWGTHPTFHGVTCAWGPGVTPGSTNYGLYLNGSAEVQIGAGTDVGIVINGSTIFTCIAGNASFYFGTGYSTGGGTGVIGISNASVVPTSNPSGGGVLYERPTGNTFAGTLTHRGLGGTIQEIAAPGTGTVNTQLATQRRITAYARTTTSGSQTIYTYVCPPSHSTVNMVITAVGRDISAPGGIVHAACQAAAFYYDGTTVTIGAAGGVLLYKTGSAGTNPITFGTLSGQNVPIQVNPASNTVDWTLTIEVTEN